MKQHGFNLPEITISVALLMIVGMGLSSTVMMVKRTMVTAEDFQRVRDLAHDVQTLLSNAEMCRFNLAGLPSERDQNGAPDVPVVQTSDGHRILSAVGAEFDRITVTKMNLVEVGSLGGTERVSELQIFSSRTGGFEFHPRKVRIIVRINSSSNIVDCFAPEPVVSITSQDICRSLNMAFNTSTQRCEVLQGVWYPGTQFLSSCPAGTILNPSMGHPMACSAPNGYEGELELRPIQYGSGESADANTSEVRELVDRAANSGRCVYRVGLDSSGFEARVNCVPESQASF